MTTIPKPVKAQSSNPWPDGCWEVIDATGQIVCNTLTEDQANEIAASLNRNEIERLKARIQQIETNK